MTQRLFLFKAIIFVSTFSIHGQSIQEKLNQGISVKTLLQQGVTNDSLYGKIYQGGYIFYLSPKDSSGMVFGLEDLAYPYDTAKSKIIWSCRGVHTGATGTAIGTGVENTKKIKAANCPLYDPDERTWMIAAAEICMEYKGAGYTDWFLPSKDELHEAYMKLSFSSIIDFGDKSYWTSSEKDVEFAWIEHFRFGPEEFEFFGQSYYMKFYGDYVRPVRIFKN